MTAFGDLSKWQASRKLHTTMITSQFWLKHLTVLYRVAVNRFKHHCVISTLVCSAAFVTLSSLGLACVCHHFSKLGSVWTCSY